MDRKHETIYSTKCDNFVDVGDGTQGPHTCATCLQTLRDDARLRDALYKDLPIDKNFKFVNKRFNGKSEAERYAKVEGLLELVSNPVRVHLPHPYIKVLLLIEFD